MAHSGATQTRYNRALYVGAATAIVLSPALTFVAAIKLRLSPPDAYGMVFLGLFVLAVLPVTLGLARTAGEERYEAFLQKMELDARIGRRGIIALWVASSLAVATLGFMRI